MIRHIVLFKFKSDAGFDKNAACTEVKNFLDTLPSKISVIRSFECGLDVLRSARSYDIAIVSTFDNLRDLETYRVHREHVKAIELIAKYKESAIAVDYEY